VCGGGGEARGLQTITLYNSRWYKINKLIYVCAICSTWFWVSPLRYYYLCMDTSNYNLCI